MGRYECVYIYCRSLLFAVGLAAGLAYNCLSVLMLPRQGNKISKVASKSNSWAIEGNHLIVKSAAARLKPSKSDRKRRESDRACVVCFVFALLTTHDRYTRV